jgi:hypothetical protein
MLSSGISFNICLKNISGRLTENRFKWDRDGFTVRKRDRDGFRPVGTGSGSGRKNFVPPDPTLGVEPSNIIPYANCDEFDLLLIVISGMHPSKNQFIQSALFSDRTFNVLLN